MRFFARAGAADADDAPLECISLQRSLRLMPTTLGLERFFVRVGAGDADWSASLSGSVRVMLMVPVLGLLLGGSWPG